MLLLKKMKYKITERRWIEIEVETEKDEKLLIDLNRDLNRSVRKAKRLRNRSVSIDELFEVYEYEFASNDESPLDVLIIDEQERLINEAVASLSNRQRFVIIKHFWNNKSLREISRETGLHLSSVAETYHRALARLGVLLIDLHN